MTVAKDAEARVESFRKCLEHAAAVHSRELSLVEDQLARLQLWMGNMRVCGPSRESLDDRLREAPEVQDTVAGLLQALTYYVDKCSSILRSMKPPDSHQPINTLDESLDNFIREAAAQISLLNKLSNTIRRTSKTKRNILAASSFQIIDDVGNDATGLLQTGFTHYIRDHLPATSDSIQKRLAATMVVRWKSVLYRRERYGKSSFKEQIPSNPAFIVSQGMAAVKKAIESVKSVKSATTLRYDHLQEAVAPPGVSATKTPDGLTGQS